MKEPICELYHDNFQNYCAWSGSTLRAAYECGRNRYGFEVDRKFYTLAKEKMLDFSGAKQLEFEV